MLTPPSELPRLPRTIPSYWPIHLYTLLQIVITVIIFIVTLTIAGPAFPIIIIALVPLRLFVMKKMWHRETLRHVDAWACRNGTPEDNEDRKAGLETPQPSPNEEEGQGIVLSRLPSKP